MNFAETDQTLVEVNDKLTRKLNQRNLIVWVLGVILVVVLIQPILSLIPNAKYNSLKNVLNPLLDDLNGKYSLSTISRVTGHKLVNEKYIVLRDEAVVYIPNDKVEEFLKDVSHSFTQNDVSVNQSVPSKSNRTGFAAIIGNSIDADMILPYLTFPRIEKNGKLIYITIEEPG